MIKNSFTKFLTNNNAVSDPKAIDQHTQTDMRRMFGDNELQYRDPYTTGYHYILFTLPNFEQGGSNKSLYQNFMASSCIAGASIPDIQVQDIEYSGLNNTKWHVPGVSTYSSQKVSFKFIEWQGTPIAKILGSWIGIFRDPIYGYGEKQRSRQQEYKGKILYITTRWDQYEVEFAASFTGVYPSKIPFGGFGSDVSTQEKVEHDVEFTFDQMYTGRDRKSVV